VSVDSEGRKDMRRIGRWGRLRAGAVDEYVKLHRAMGAELRAAHSRAGLRNFTIYRLGLELFSYLEVADWDAALAYLAEDSLSQEWLERMKGLLDDPLPWPFLEEVFHLD
jgi:L-rhamnose mutarotase